MKRDKYMTARWNNILAFGLAIPLLAYTVFALMTSALTPCTEHIILVAAGVVY